jgi:acetoacetyl-CoA synthetase
MTAPFVPQIRLYQDWLRTQRGLVFDDYDALWRWSVTDLDAFWQSVWDYFEIASPTPHHAVLATNRMPGAQWFPGAQVNYLHQVLRHVEPAHAAGMPAIVACNERGQRRELGWPELRRQVAALALHLRAQGVQPGDRVAAYLPNIPEAMVAFLATVGIGAVWSICAPDMGTHAVLDRFRQIEPTVLIGVDGVTYGGRDMDRCAVLQELRAQLPSVRHVLLVNDLDATKTIADSALFTDVMARNDAEVAAFEPLWLPFDHPLWIVYSSGTTGLPKPIVHGHGGMILVSLQLKGLHNDVGLQLPPQQLGRALPLVQLHRLGHVERADGGPAGRHHLRHLRRQPRRQQGAARLGHALALCRRDRGHLLRRRRRLLRQLHEGGPGTGRMRQPDPHPRAGHHRLSAGARSAAVGDGAVSGHPCHGRRGAAARHLVEQHLGRHRFLRRLHWRPPRAAAGAGRDAVPHAGRRRAGLGRAGPAVVDAVGELVCTQPIPSMPLYLWGDADGSRYLSSYFDMYPPGHGRQPGGGDGPPAMGAVWRHGDWLRIGAHGGCTIYGRSDATINRHGLRMGTSEIYSAVEALPEVLDSLVVDLEYLGRESYMPLFVVLREGCTLDDALRARIHAAIRTALSPRFVPDAIFAVAEVPRTLSGKKQELPIKKLLLGQPIEKVVNRDAMANPGCLDWYVDFAAQRGEEPLHKT